MERRIFLNGLFAAATLVVTSTAAFSATFAEDVVAQLTHQGFFNIVVETTWLGRVRIVANRRDGQREIVLNPRTGEVLRDTWQIIGKASTTPIIDDVGVKTAPSGDSAGSSGGDSTGSSGDDSAGSGDSTGSSGGDSQGDGGGNSGSDGSGTGSDGSNSGNDSTSGGGSSNSGSGSDSGSGSGEGNGDSGGGNGDDKSGKVN